MLLIAKNGWPMETIENRPVINFLRRLLHGSHYVCRDCWYHRQAMKNSTSGGGYSPSTHA